jgi:hypothetical protein
MKQALAFILLVLPQLALAAMHPGTDPREYSGPAWSPYIVGAGIGVLSWLTFYFSDKAIGASSFYATLAGLVGKSRGPAPHCLAQVLQRESAKAGLGSRLRRLRNRGRLLRGVDRR